MTLRVGLTGGIGSGKSTVAKIFETLGIPVYYADDRAKELMNTNEALREKIKQLLGPEAYEDNILKRDVVASKVFGNAALLQQLNALVHPITIADAEAWMQAQQAPYAIKEAALLFEAGADKALDNIITVTAPQELRLKRVIQRDGSTAQKVQERMNRQMPEAEKISRSHFVIYNDETQLLIPQVINLHQQLIQKSKGL